MYQKAIAANPKFALPYNNLGVVRERQGRRDEALTLYRKALQVDPNYRDARLNLNRFSESGR